MKTATSIVTLVGMLAVAGGILFMLGRFALWLIEQAATHTWVWGAVAVLLGLFTYAVGWTGYQAAERKEAADRARSRE